MNNQEKIMMVMSAMRGERGPDQAKIAEEALDWTVTLLTKNNDYGGSAWQAPFLNPKLGSCAGLLCRMSDKIHRIRQLLGAEDQAEVNETLDDTFRDLGAYCLLYLAKPEGRGEETNTPNPFGGE